MLSSGRFDDYPPVIMEKYVIGQSSMKGNRWFFLKEMLHPDMLYFFKGDTIYIHSRVYDTITSILPIQDTLFKPYTGPYMPYMAKAGHLEAISIVPVK